MARTTWVLATTTVIGFATSAWLFVENRSLREHRTAAPAAAGSSASAVAETTPATATGRTSAARSSSRPTQAPALPEPTQESRMERRARRQQEFAAMFGRADGETEDEYRARIVPLIKAGLLVPRQRLDEMRKEAEQKAKVTPEQSKKLDQAFDKIYGDVIDYTNKAVADGQLSPYERNVAGWLEYAGGLGGILTDAESQIGKVLSADQVKTMSDAGFEWGEYLGVNAPWEQLTPPPPPKPH